MRLDNVDRCRHDVGMTNTETTKVTLLGPTPWGGSYTSTTDDPIVQRLIAEGWTVSRTWPLAAR